MSTEAWWLLLRGALTLGQVSVIVWALFVLRKHLREQKERRDKAMTDALSEGLDGGRGVDYGQLSPQQMEYWLNRIMKP